MTRQNLINLEMFLTKRIPTMQSRHTTPTLLLALFLFGCLAGQVYAQRSSQNNLNFVMYYESEFETSAGFPSGTVVMLQNQTQNPIQLTAWIEGDPEFGPLFYDPIGTPSDTVRVDVPTLIESPVWVSFQTAAAGDYTTKFIVTDGTVSDTVEITAHVKGSAGNFIADLGYKDIYLRVGET
ncbi:MAG: hypothetical protein CL946_12120, partial [Ectothiorhodospiraceae bacterium]|nr:hypothetical protein [Ectothiorhodospiraceae bacterium]